MPNRSNTIVVGLTDNRIRKLFFISLYTIEYNNYNKVPYPQNSHTITDYIIPLPFSVKHISVY